MEVVFELITSTSVETKERDLIPLDKAAKIQLEKSGLPYVDAPVFFLQALLAKLGTTPKYELIQIEGAINEPIFKYRLTLTSICGKVYNGVGSGKSKKDAKQGAARNVLNQLLGFDCTNSFNLQSDVNPIGLLQEACLARKWPPPLYETEETQGQPHDRMYTVCAYVSEYKESGMGKSKKEAKRKAAQNMLYLLEDVPISSCKKEEDEEEEDFEDEDEDDLQNSKQEAYLTPQQLKAIGEYHKLWRERTKGPFIKKLLGTNIELIDDPEQFLEEVCYEMQCKTMFVDIEETAKSGNFQTIVQISTNPVNVFHGTGPTLEESKQDAIIRALSFLKIMYTNDLPAALTDDYPDVNVEMFSNS